MLWTFYCRRKNPEKTKGSRPKAQTPIRLALLLRAHRDDQEIMRQKPQEIKPLTLALTSLYVDGFNLYHAIDALGVPHLKWVNLKALAATFLRPGDSIHEVVYFSALMTWDQGKQARHKEYIAALESVGVVPIMSAFQATTKHCQRHDRYCAFKEEKQTDVAFAVRVLADALSNGVERAILLTADSDQAPMVGAVRRFAPNVEVSLACPPGRLVIARALTGIVHDFREVRRGRIEQCLFPRNVRDAAGRVVARCPARYGHPRPND